MMTTYKLYFNNGKESAEMTRTEMKKAVASIIDRPWLLVREVCDFVVLTSNFKMVLDVHPSKGYLVDHSNFFGQGKAAVLDI